MMEELAQILGFKVTMFCSTVLYLLQYELFVAPDGSYGQLEGEGEDSWGGMVGELAAKRADIGLGALSVMAERETVIGTDLLPFKHTLQF